MPRKRLRLYTVGYWFLRWPASLIGLASPRLGCRIGEAWARACGYPIGVEHVDGNRYRYRIR